MQEAGNVESSHLRFHARISSAPTGRLRRFSEVRLPSLVD